MWNTQLFQGPRTGLLTLGLFTRPFDWVYDCSEVGFTEFEVGFTEFEVGFTEN